MPGWSSIQIGRRVQVARGRGETLVLLLRQLASPELLRVDATLGAEQALHELLGRHLEREHRDRNAVRDRRVGRDVERHRRLPHRRARGDDAEVALLKARRHAVEVREARGHAGDPGVGLLQALDVLERRPEDLLDPDEALALVALGDLEDARLGLVEDLVDVALALLVDVPDDLRRLLHEPAQQRLVADDACVVLDVGGGRNRVDEGAQVVEASGRLELSGLLELLRDRDHVDHVAALEETHHRAVQAPVRLPVEHPVVEVLDRARHGLAVDQHAAEHGGLRLHREGRRPIENGLLEGRGGFHGKTSLDGSAAYAPSMIVAEQLEVVPERPRPLGVPKQRGRVVGDKSGARPDRNAPLRGAFRAPSLLAP